jgi:ubiquinone/menaquinone biosynthesis C-methylase UbiE
MMSLRHGLAALWKRSKSMVRAESMTRSIASTTSEVFGNVTSRLSPPWLRALKECLQPRTTRLDGQTCDAPLVSVESEETRRRRRHQRTLFDRVAELYDASRRGYPKEIVHFMLAAAGLETGGVVLEVGCGTGQLTEQLAHYGLKVTAIDISPAMVTAARRRVGRSAVRFDVVSFEEFDAADTSFDLVVSATAFHWVDPEVKFAKSARLLRPDGWLALLATGERYDDPFGAALLDMWVARSDDAGTWAKQRKLSDTEIINTAGLFDTPVEKTQSERLRLSRDVVIGVESTRATSLSWSDEIRQDFIDELRQHLRFQPQVTLTQETSLSMARALRRP